MSEIPEEMTHPLGDLEPEEFRRRGYQVIDWVADYLDGGRVSERVDDPSDFRQSGILNAMASTIGKLHGAGYRHGDLHLGNLRTNGTQIALLDVQRARPQRKPGDRIWDIAQLEL